MHARTERILTALAKIMLDVPSSQLPALESIGFTERLEKHVQALPPLERRCFILAAWCFEIVALFSFAARFRRFTQLSTMRQRKYFATWRQTKILPKRLMRRFLECIIQLVYYSAPAVSAACGWRPEFAPPKPRPSLPEGQWQRFAPDDAPSSGVTLSPEFVVIGSGAGGAVVAESLAAQGHEVLIVEEGDYLDASQYRGDILRATAELYRDAGTTTTFGWPMILVPHGSAVGGTTVVNSGTMLRTPEKILARWQTDFGLADWNHAAMAEHFAAAESGLQVAPVTDAVQGPHAKIFAAGAQSLGHIVSPLPRNAPDCLGSGVCCFGCPTNAKLSMALTYLPRALSHGARLLANARIDRLHVHGNRVTRITGVWKRRNANGTSASVRLTIAPRHVVVAAGSLHTPLILLRSGLRDRFRHVGRHLTLHPAVKVFAEMPHEVSAWRGVPQGMYSEALANIGVKLEAIFLPPSYVAMALTTSGGAHRQVMERYNHLVGFGAMISDTSEGWVRPLPAGRRLIYYRMNNRDLPRYRDTVEYLARVFFAAGAERVYPAWHRAPVIERRQGTDWLRKLPMRRSDLDLQAFHPLGTCRMAADPALGAVDGSGHWFGLTNLCIADGSLFPTALGVNPQLTIMAAARKIAQGLHEKC